MVAYMPPQTVADTKALLLSFAKQNLYIIRFTPPLRASISLIGYSNL